jgi:hypothetical protein
MRNGIKFGQTLRIAGAAFALTVATTTLMAPAARAQGIPPPNLPNLQQFALPSGAPNLPGLPGSSGSTGGGQQTYNLTLPNHPPSTSTYQGYQGFLPTVPSGHAALPDHYLNPEYYYYWDYFRGWGIMRVEFSKFNYWTGSSLFKIWLYHLERDHYGNYRWVESHGSGSKKDHLFTFSLNRANDGLGELYFEGIPNHWSTYHPVGDPHHPRWFYFQPF